MGHLNHCAYTPVRRICLGLCTTKAATGSWLINTRSIVMQHTINSWFLGPGLKIHHIEIGIIVGITFIDNFRMVFTKPGIKDWSQTWPLNQGLIVSQDNVILCSGSFGFVFYSCNILLKHNLVRHHNRLSACIGFKFLLFSILAAVYFMRPFCNGSGEGLGTIPMLFT